MQPRNRYLIAGLAVLGVLAAARIALPYLLAQFVNNKLASLPAYQGRVSDIDVSLLRGAYRIEGIEIHKREVRAAEPFFAGSAIDLSLEWPSLLHGSIVGEVVFDRPVLNLIQARADQQQQLGKEVNWGEQLSALFPFRLNTAKVHNGTIRFQAPGIRSEDALTATQIDGALSNLTNAVDSAKEVFANFDVTAHVLKSGAASLRGSINPLAATPTFDVNLAVERVKLPQVNPWLREYLKADAASGDFELYLEIAAADGRFKGYAKPLMQNVELHGTEDESKPALRKIWEGLVDFAAKVFENDDKQQVAARVPFTGTVKNPKAGLLEAFFSVLHNAFVGAFANSLEGSISLRDVKQELEPYELDDKKDNKEHDGNKRTPAARSNPKSL